MALVPASSTPTALPPSGAAGGDLGGTYPNPTVATTGAVKSIAKAGSTALTGAVTLTGGTNVTLTQAGQDVSIAAAGGAQAVELLGPFAIAFNTAGLDNPPGNGALVGPVLTAGTLVLCVWIETTTPWTATVSVDEVDLILDTSNTSLLAYPTNPATLLNANVYPLQAGSSPPYPAVVQASTDRIAVAFYSTANLTAGAGNVFALVAAF